ncbi:hypothetical protein [Maridesulfovibrio hydrothermalis]|uniref:Uncharacterized protein n=1 Tax=Maridesulfovibrio hydrothermalis AM13 = DSM 14728 TaxID=1121451 RepID=L0RFB3_9BACT|nr:hypothetical protein [Maridesulfovibrio hydrothermalis]CCO25424.1 conserved protein of unknown function [Maridesulfovibrio hydrothermalis AM13 = DSM 14728]
MSDAMQGSSQVPEKKIRIDFYLSILGGLKERNMLREVLEREVFLEFIKYNNNRINEFPLLEKQQSSIIGLLCHRATDLPAHEFIKKILSEFILMLGRFGKLKDGKDKDTLDSIRSRIINAETLLIKTVQGVVYASCLISDNFEEVTLRHFGESALKKYNALLEEFELDREFWQSLIEKFIISEVSSSLQDIVADESYSLTRDKSYLILRFPFDAVTGRFAVEAPAIDKTRIQSSFENVGVDEESIETLKMTYKTLQEGSVFIRSEGMTNENIERIARIVCLDPATTKFREDYDKAMDEMRATAYDANSDEKEEEIARQLQFAQDQIGACAIGASLTLDIVVRDFLLGLKNYNTRDEKILSLYLRRFDVESLDKLFFYLTESKFSNLLKSKMRGEESKLLLRVVKRRRVPLEKVKDLNKIGMTRIRMARLWMKDSTNENWLIFKHNTAQELVKELQLLALEKELATAIVKLFEKGDFKVEFLVFISLQAIAKATKDVRGKLNELLMRFGIGEQSDEQIAKKLKNPAK